MENTPVKGNTRAPLKITVLKKLSTQELYSSVPEGVIAEAQPLCPKFQVGQTFIVDKTGNKPADFPCEWAWNDIYSLIVGLQMGGHYIRFRKGLQYTCCSDGLRPVFFKLEIME